MSKILAISSVVRLLFFVSASKGAAETDPSLQTIRTFRLSESKGQAGTGLHL